MTISTKALAGALILSIVLAPPLALAKTPVATGTGGAVATISEKASASAIAILNKGGNAIDAAVAAAATLGVTDPFSCGIGGGGFMVIYLAKDKRVITIDHRETAPASFSPSVFQENGKPIDFDTAVASGASVGVPGTVRGWHEALQRYGTMSFKQVLAPAIEVATKGFPVSETFHNLTAENEGKFQLFASTSQLYLKNGKAVPTGTILKNPDMAKAYREIAARGYKAFYEGPMAQAIVGAVNRPPLAARSTAGAPIRPGAMSMADLANYEARIRQPVRSTYRGYDVYGMSLPSSGGVTVAEALNILEGYDLKAMPRPNVEHLYLEASRLAFADRNAYLADPEYVDAPIDGILSKQFAAQRRSLIRPDKAAAVVPAGDAFLYENDQSFPLRPQQKLIQEGTHTTHLTVSDKEGNVVSYTFTIESWGGSGIVVPGYGFLLNNEMTDFDFTGPAPNIPEAGKRPRSSMAPTIVLKDGKPAFTIGSPGGATIITTVLQTIVNYLDLGMPMDKAIDAPRLSQRNAKETSVEPGFIGTQQARGLENFGHKWETSPPPEEIGAANALVFNPDGTVTAVSEGHRHGIGTALVQKRGH
ncbi:gamma-glutamyltransferase [Massilia sp. WF1]|uniref:gamma-glutamyltransferase n=1 Tax=unclassified Massilia TaxID=2609279 RepID=UPI000689B0EE|nr:MULTISPECIES: gamma-glutamyltransferase [unclassified Massilia]ALK95836.1 gamma-glutamyltransferase [Massilia sp. WG5]KNZ67945.1 gamma-glutamyltransferase [Massilia sp. WF1]